MLLEDTDPTLAILRGQYEQIQSMKEELTGTGFYLEFVLSKQACPIPGNPTIRFGDVDADLDGLEHGAGFLLFIQDGFLSMLEGYSYEEPWPEQPVKFTLSYENGIKRNTAKLMTTPGWPSVGTTNGKENGKVD